MLEWAKGRWVRANYAAAFVAGERAADYAGRLGIPANRIWRGYDVVDNCFFQARAGEARRDAAAVAARFGLEMPFLLYVGRLAAVKNLEFLLCAYESYRKAAPVPWRLVLAGDGPLTRRLHSRAGPGVRFLGHREPHDVAALYGIAGALVLPSLSEPWGLVVNEAMAAGLPAIVSDRCGCVPELVEEGVTGFTFDPRDPGALVTALRAVSAPEADREALSRAARERVASLTPETWARALADCVSTLLRERA